MKMIRALFGHPEKEQPSTQGRTDFGRTNPDNWLATVAGNHQKSAEKGSDMSVNNKPRSNQSVH